MMNPASATSSPLTPRGLRERRVADGYVSARRRIADAVVRLGYELNFGGKSENAYDLVDRRHDEFSAIRGIYDSIKAVAVFDNAFAGRLHVIDVRSLIMVFVQLHVDGAACPFVIGAPCGAQNEGAQRTDNTIF